MGELRQTLLELQRDRAGPRLRAPEERELLEPTMHWIEQTLAEATPVADEETPAPGDALEGAAVRLEAEHPGVAGAVRALVDALSKAGI